MSRKLASYEMGTETRREDPDYPRTEFRLGNGRGGLHNENGPAVIYDTGIKQWFLNGFEYTEKIWTFKMRKRKLEALGI